MATIYKAPATTFYFSQVSTVINEYVNRPLDAAAIDALTQKISSLNTTNNDLKTNGTIRRRSSHLLDKTIQKVVEKNLKMLKEVFDPNRNIEYVYLPQRMPLIAEITTNAKVSILTSYEGDVITLHHLPDNQSFVVQDKKTKEHPMLGRELTILSSIPSHPFIPEYLGVDEQANLVTAYAEHGDLRTSLKQTSTLSYHKIIYQVASALKHLHENNVIHCDCKPSNIVLTKDGNAQLTDFDLSIRLSTEQLKLLKSSKPIWLPPHGTLMYTPPEYYLHQRWTQQVPVLFQGDTWSYGCVVFELLDPDHKFLISYLLDASQWSDSESDSDSSTSVSPTHLHFFRSFSVEELQQLIIKQIDKSYAEAKSKNLPIPTYFPDLAKECLVVDYKKRPTIHQIIKNYFWLE